MLKYENTAEVGDTIKTTASMSDRPDRYVRARSTVGEHGCAGRAFTIIVDDDSGDMTPGPDAGSAARCSCPSRQRLQSSRPGCQDRGPA